MIKKYSAYFLFQFLTGLIPFFILPYLYLKLDTFEFISYSSLAIISSLILLFDMRLGILVLNTAAQLKNNYNKTDHLTLNALYSYFTLIALVSVLLILCLGPAYSSYMTASVSYSGILLYFTIPLRLLIGFYRRLSFGFGSFTFPNKVMFIFSLLRFSGVIFIFSEIHISFFLFCLLFLFFTFCELYALKSKPMIKLNFSLDRQLFILIKSKGLIIFITALLSYCVQNLDRYLIPMFIAPSDLSDYLLLVNVSLSVLFILNPFSAILNRKLAVSNFDLSSNIFLTILIISSCFVLAFQIFSNFLLSDLITIISHGDLGVKQVPILTYLVIGNILFYLYGVLYFIAVANNKILRFLYFNLLSVPIYGVVAFALGSSITNYQILFPLSWFVLNQIRLTIFAPFLFYSISGVVNHRIIFCCITFSVMVLFVEYLGAI